MNALSFRRISMGWRSGLMEIPVFNKRKCKVTAEANSILGCRRKSAAIREEEVILPLCSILVRQLWSARSRSGLISTRKTRTYGSGFS